MPTPIIEPLGSEHDRAAFSCGLASLDRYIAQQASQDMRNRVAAPFVRRFTDSQRIIGYYTLSAYTIELAELPEPARKRLPRYPKVPAVLLGRLAVDREFTGGGWGEVLLVDALCRSLDQSHQIGAMAVVVDAVDDNARSFYARYGFERLVDHEYRLYLPMKTIEQSF